MMALRVARVTGYTAMATVGIVMLEDPSSMVRGQMEWMTPIWASMLVAGGSLSSTGVVTRIWAGETLGLPFLYAATCMWGLAYLREWPYTSTRFAAGVFLFGVACLLFAHWRGMMKFGNEAIEARLYEKRVARGKH